MIVLTLARKPLTGTVASTLTAHGTGGLNIGSSRVGLAGGTRRDGKADKPNGAGWENMKGHGIATLNSGRWPANVVFEHLKGCTAACKPACPVSSLDEQSEYRVVTTTGSDALRKASTSTSFHMPKQGHIHKDAGTAARFFHSFGGTR